MSTCYFNYLVPELVQEIFLFCVVKRSGHFIKFKHDAPPLVLLHVCKRWRAIAYSTSGLFDSITLRRRTHAPIGFDFFRDSYVLLDFLKFTRNAAPWHGSDEPIKESKEMLPPRPLSIELRYGDIKQFGNTLMWSDLVSMTRALMDTTSNLERFHLRFPDDCMERLLSKICLHSGKKVVNHALKSLSLHSTRESVLVKRYENWWNDDSGNAPSRIHKLDTSGLPALTELGLHFPGPLELEPKCMNIRKLNISVFKWSQFEEYLNACPNVENLTIELRASLMDRMWEALNGKPDLSKVHTLEIRSHLSGLACACHIATLLVKLRLPKLRRLVLRRHHRADLTEPAPFVFINEYKPNFQQLEEIEFIDVAIEPYGLKNIDELLASMPKLKRFVYREVQMSSTADYMTVILHHLASCGQPLRAPFLEVIEINTGHYRMENPEQNLIDGVLYVIMSLREELPPANTREAEEQTERHLLREFYIPRSCFDPIRRRNAQWILEGVHLGPSSDIEPLENEDDLDDEGEPRDPGYQFERPNWQDDSLNADRGDACSSEASTEDEEILDADDLDHEHSDLDMDYSLDYEEDEDMDSMSSNTLVGNSQSSRSSSHHSVSALRRYDSVAEVELML